MGPSGPQLNRHYSYECWAYRILNVAFVKTAFAQPHRVSIGRKDVTRRNDARVSIVDNITTSPGSKAMRSPERTVALFYQ